VTPGIRWAVGAVLSTAIVFGIVACGNGGASEDAASNGGRPSLEVCAVLEVSLEHTPNDRSFAALVQGPSDDGDLVGTAAAVFLLRRRYDGDLGPYEPVIDHLADLGRVNAEERGKPPKAGEDVIASARRLDRDLDDGLCG